MSRLLSELGHTVLVGNPRRLRAIYQADFKDDGRVAEMLARIARMDPKLHHLIRHRGKSAQADLAVLKARDAAVEVRAKLINSVRGAVKSFGGRLPSSSAEAFPAKAAPELPEVLRPALEPLLAQIASLSKTIRDYDRLVENRCAQAYPETEVLRSVHGVGPVTA